MTKEILEIHEQRGQVEQASPWFEIDQEVDVAGRVGLPTRDRPEDANIASTWRAAMVRICPRTRARSSIDGRSAMRLLLVTLSRVSRRGAVEREDGPVRFVGVDLAASLAAGDDATGAIVVPLPGRR
jgi:hypothetical protein